MPWAFSRTLRSVTTMSTSDPQLDEATVLQTKAADAAALPDVVTLTQMANAIFRALPGQDVAIPASPEPHVPIAPTTPTVSGSNSYLPQFGYPAPSLPALPSYDKLPNEADFARLSGSGVPVNFPVEATSFTGTPSLSQITRLSPRPPLYPPKPVSRRQPVRSYPYRHLACRCPPLNLPSPLSRLLSLTFRHSRRSQTTTLQGQ